MSGSGSVSSDSTMGCWTDTMARPARRTTRGWVRLSTKATCRLPMGDIVTISPRISSTRSVGLRIPASPIR